MPSRNCTASALSASLDRRSSLLGAVPVVAVMVVPSSRRRAVAPSVHPGGSPDPPTAGVDAPAHAGVPRWLDPPLRRCWKSRVATTGPAVDARRETAMSALTDTFTMSNGVQIPKIGFGTWQIPDGEQAYDSVRTALDAGYRHIDTALAYGNEESVGRAVKDSGVDRDEIFITTKLPAEIKDADGARRAFEKSQRGLDLGVVDLY